jgi:feruloyl esterase
MAVLAGAALFVWGAGAEDGAFAQTAGGQIRRSPRELCSALQNTVIPRDAIGLPTGGAVVVAASLVARTDAGNANGEFCKVLGSIHPVDPLAPPIRFQLNLPTTSTHK